MGIGRLVGGAAAAGVAVFAGVSGIGDETTRDDAGEIVESGGLGVFAFQIGDCIQFPAEDADLIESVEGVPCTAPHDAQVYVEFDLPDGDFPGDAAVSQAATDGCYQAFDAAIGVSYDDTPELDFTFLSPVREGWAQGDREISCFVAQTDGTQWTGSALAVDREPSSAE